MIQNLKGHSTENQVQFTHHEGHYSALCVSGGSATKSVKIAGVPLQQISRLEKTKANGAFSIINLSILNIL